MIKRETQITFRYVDPWMDRPYCFVTWVDSDVHPRAGQAISSAEQRFKDELFRKIEILDTTVTPMPPREVE